LQGDVIINTLKQYEAEKLQSRKVLTNFQDGNRKSNLRNSNFSCSYCYW